MSENTNSQDCMDWDDTIGNGEEKSGDGFRYIDEGDYYFEVVGLNRGRSSGTGKLPPCNKAGLILRVDDGRGPIDVRCDMILHRSLEWKLKSFFKSIGQRKSGESLKMDWDSVVGCTGFGHFKPKEYTDGNGKNHKINYCEKFLEKPEDYRDDEHGWHTITEGGDPLPF